MWRYFANRVLRNRFFLVVLLLLCTALFGYRGSHVQLSYELAKVLPATDSTLIEYETFKKLFGEDGSILVLGFQDDQFFTLEKFNDWYHLAKDIKQIAGIREVMSVGTLYNVVINDSLKKIEFMPIVSRELETEQELDSIKSIIHSLPFYDGLIYNKETGSTLMAVSFKNKDLNTKHRIEIVNKIKARAETFSEKHKLQLHISGMPYIRTAIMEKVSHEIVLFLVLAVVVMAIILWFFFRSFRIVFFSIGVVTIGVVWSLGTIELLQYRITMLSGLIPPLIMVIGIPNCVFLINKYHNEFVKHGNKIKSLSRMIETIGGTLFLANITTAIGFGVLYFTDTSLLVEFGIVAAINVLFTFIITLILIPIILSFLPSPKQRHTKHLDSKRINSILAYTDMLVHERRKGIYIVVSIITLISLYGMTKIKFIGYVVDDLPDNDPIYTDLKFFESNFNGILPFEISVDSKKENGLFADKGTALYKINRLQKVFASYPEFSKPLSVVEGIKFSYQAYRNGDSKYYVLPGATDLNFLNRYTSTVKGNESKLQAFVDNNKQTARISIQIADVGSRRMKELVNEIKPRIDSIFNPVDYNVKFTGHSLMFLKGNDYLLNNLLESLFIEILLITLLGFALFKSFRIILLSKLPVLIPLIITAGIMGFLDIRFKPSTILIFSIAFGISSDGTIYFLTRYRQELKKQMHSVTEAISITIRETGIGMIYTAVILFAGFAIFAVSGFGGTKALGILISVTLSVAMVTNLVLLPALLLSIDNRISQKEMLEKPFIELDEDSTV